MNMNETRCEECGCPVEDDMCLCYVCAQRNDEAEYEANEITVEKYGFGSPEHKEARGYFYEAKDQYEEYCRNAGIPAYAFYSED